MKTDLVTALACVCNGWIILGYEWDDDENLKSSVTHQLEDWFALNPESEGFSEEAILGEIARKTGTEIRTILSQWMQSDIDEYVEEIIEYPPVKLKAFVIDWMKDYAEHLSRMQVVELKKELSFLMSHDAQQIGIGGHHVSHKKKLMAVFENDAPQISPFQTSGAISVNPIHSSKKGEQQ